MFKELHKKFFLFSMIVSTLFVLFGLSVVFWVSFTNEKNNNLYSLRDWHPTLYSDNTTYLEKYSELTPKAYISQPETNPNPTNKDSLKNKFGFSVKAKYDGTIIADSEWTENFSNSFKKMAKIAINKKKHQALFISNGRVWGFSRTSFHTNNEPFSYAKATTEINFQDMTSVFKKLFKNFLLFSVVGIGILAILYGVSRSFANKIIQPVRDAVERQKKFIADASHELKTPLMIINANYDVLQNNCEDTIKNQQKWLNNIKVGSERMSLLVNDMLLLTKVEDPAFVIEKDIFNYSELISEITSSMNAMLVEKNISVLEKIDPNIMVKNDKKRIEQVINILFDNAIKYVNQGGHIEISLFESKKETVFMISNTGIGIPVESIPKVFDRFYRVDQSRAKIITGHGLGLSIARSILDLLGGTISVKSIKNERTIFTVSLKN